jgi:hypothetical protein
MRQKLAMLLMVLMTRIAVGQQTSHVIVVVIDGARYSETYGDPSHQWIPRIWGNLRPQGAIFTSYSNDGITETNPGHGSIVTGTWQNIANDGSERPHFPTVFEYCRKELNAPAEDTYVVLGKTKLNILAYSDYAGYGTAYGATVTNSASEYNDQMAAENVISVLQMHHPRLLVVNLPATDVAGHSGVWEEYVTALRRADSLVYAIWGFVQSDPTLSGTTTMFVTNDHGRHLDNVDGGFSGHGDGCEGCRHILLLAIGPNTPAGAVDASPRKQIDIAPTIGQLLGFATSFATGTAIDMSALPVQLVHFTGRFVSGRGVELQWTTLTETNNFGFYVQRNMRYAGVFLDIPSSFRPGYGTSLVAHSYRFEDTTVGSGWWLYRLKQIDLDGTVSFTEPIAVGPVFGRTMPASVRHDLLQNYPNPFNPTTVITYSVPAPAERELASGGGILGLCYVRLSVYDLLGREVAVLVDEGKSPGTYDVSFSPGAGGVPALAGGVYFYSLQTRSTDDGQASGLIRTRRMLLLK